MILLNTTEIDFLVFEYIKLSQKLEQMKKEFSF